MNPKQRFKTKNCKYLLYFNVIIGVAFFWLHSKYAQHSKSNLSVVRLVSTRNKTFLKLSTVNSSKDFGKRVLGNFSRKNLVKVVLWTEYFSDNPLLAVSGNYRENCPVRCQFTSGRDEVQDADAVVFHSRDIKSSDFPTNHPNKQIWIYMNQESPANTRQDLRAIPNVFNWTMTYRTDSDIYHPYGEVVSNSQFLELLDENKLHFLNRGKLRHQTSFGAENEFGDSGSHNIDIAKNIQAIVAGKTKLVAWVVSHCKTQSQRERLVKTLTRYIPVDIFGDCGNHTCPRDSASDCFSKIEKTYKFYLSFENSLCTDYVTEKLFNLLNLSIVPIVYGGADYSKIAPPGSYIDAKAFTSPKDLADYLIYLDNNLTEYLKYFSWKKQYKVIPGTGWCSLCVKLSEKMQNKTLNAQTKWFTNLWKWWQFKVELNGGNYQIGVLNDDINEAKLIIKTERDYSNYSGYDKPTFVTSREDSENTNNLFPICLTP